MCYTHTASWIERQQRFCVKLGRLIFPSWNSLNTSCIRSLNHRHRLCHGQKHTQAPGHLWAIILLNHGNATLRVASRGTYKTIPPTRSRRMKSKIISGVGSTRRVRRRTMKTCWRKETLLCSSQASKTGIASRSSWLECQMIRLSGSGNYTLSTIWDGMTIPNALSNPGVETSSKAWDGWCGTQLTLSISCTPLSAASTAVLLYGDVCSSSRVCAGVCEVVSIVSCNETCCINIRSIDD